MKRSVAIAATIDDLTSSSSQILHTHTQCTHTHTHTHTHIEGGGKPWLVPHFLTLTETGVTETTKGEGGRQWGGAKRSALPPLLYPHAPHPDTPPYTDKTPYDSKVSYT